MSYRCGSKLVYTNHRQSVRSLPCAKQPYLLKYSTHTVKVEDSLIHLKSITPSKFTNTGKMVKKGTYWFFQDNLDSFQDHYLNHCKSNISNSIWLISHQNKYQPIKVKFLNLLCSCRSIVILYEQIWQSVKNTQKHGNFHNNSDRTLTLTPEVISIGSTLYQNVALYSYY